MVHTSDLSSPQSVKWLENSLHSSGDDYISRVPNPQTTQGPCHHSFQGDCLEVSVCNCLSILSYNEDCLSC